MLSELIDDNVALLEQSLALIAALPNGVYAAVEEGRRGGTGAHVRHLLDHYSALIEGVAGGRVDYEARAREERIERDGEYAMQRIEALIAGLRSLASYDRAAALHVTGDGHAAHSTLGRELQFLLSHTVHHQALIALLVQQQGVRVDASFGVAPSTLRHWGLLAPAAPLREAIGNAVTAGREDA